jgi:hypothetical protein
VDELVEESTVFGGHLDMAATPWINLALGETGPNASERGLEPLQDCSHQPLKLTGVVCSVPPDLPRAPDQGLLAVAMCSVPLRPPGTKRFVSTSCPTGLALNHRKARARSPALRLSRDLGAISAMVPLSA